MSLTFTSTLSLYPHRQVSNQLTNHLLLSLSLSSNPNGFSLWLQARLRYRRLQPSPLSSAEFVWLPSLKSRRPRVLRAPSRCFVVRASAGIGGGTHRVHRQSQATASPSIATVKQIANTVAPFGIFFALTFGIHCTILLSCSHSVLF